VFLLIAPFGDQSMKLATFNINNINRRLPNLLRWLKDAKPDVVCLQELKCTDGDFPAKALAKAGYRSVWRGQRRSRGGGIASTSPRRYEWNAPAADKLRRRLLVRLVSVAEPKFV
jgi:exonuclease III